MADTEEQTTEAAPKRSMKVVIIVAGLMAVEALGVFLFLTMTGGGPVPAGAGEIVVATEDPEALVEVEVLNDKFQNMTQGRVWLWDLELYVKVKRKHQEWFLQQLELNRAETRGGIAEIIRKAPHTQLTEPGLEAINRQLTAYLQGVFRPVAPDEPARIDRVLIPRCRGFPADF